MPEYGAFLTVSSMSPCAHLANRGADMDMLTDTTIRMPEERPDDTGGGSYGAAPRDKGARVAGLLQGKGRPILGGVNLDGRAGWWERGWSLGGGGSFKKTTTSVRRR